MSDDDLPGYPKKRRDLLLNRAEDRFAENVTEHGLGKNWLGGNPDYLAFHGIRNLVQAADHVVDAETDEALAELADAMNYTLFLVDVALEEAEQIDGGDEA